MDSYHAITPSPPRSQEANSSALTCSASLRVLASHDDVLAYFAFPEPHWRKIRSTNPLERLNKELKRRTGAIGLFPDEGSVIRLLGAILVEQDDEWRVAPRRYFSADSMKPLLLTHAEEQPAHPTKEAALPKAA